MTQAQRTLLFLLLSSAALCGSVRAAGPTSMTELEIVSALEAGCSRSHRLEHYRGVGNRYDVIGPLWLTKPGEGRPRGVILPPFLRVYLYGRSRRCKKLGAEHVEKARALAGPEVWVVLWRHEGPPKPYESGTTSVFPLTTYSKTWWAAAFGRSP